MRQKRAAGTGGGEKTIRDIRRATRRQYSAVENSELSEEGQERTLSLAGGGVIVERLESMDDVSTAE